MFSVITSLGRLRGCEGCEEEDLFSTTWTLIVETSQRNVYTAQVAVPLPSSMVSSVTVHGVLTGPRLD